MVNMAMVTTYNSVYREVYACNLLHVAPALVRCSASYLCITALIHTALIACSTR